MWKLCHIKSSKGLEDKVRGIKIKIETWLLAIIYDVQNSPIKPLENHSQNEVTLILKLSAADIKNILV
jgi:hypothetical protein